MHVASPPIDASSQPPPGARVDPACALARRAVGGDEAAFEALIALHHARIFALVRSMVGGDADAQEVLQEASLQVHRALPSIVPPANDRALSAWMFRVAVNAALMHLRARRRRPTLSLEDVPQVAAGPWAVAWPGAAPVRRPDDALLEQELLARTHHALQQLPDKYRLVMWLRDIEEQNNEEVAQTLGLTLPTVKARLHRARLAVREALAPYLKAG